MPVRAAVATVVAMLVLVVAVTPLNAVFRPAYFDLRYTDTYRSIASVTLEDQTGLVMGIAPDPNAVPSLLGRTSSLVVSWRGGCTNPNIYMRFIALAHGYQLSERTRGGDSQSLCGVERTFLLVLRAPVDASQVEIVHE